MQPQCSIRKEWRLMASSQVITTAPKNPHALINSKLHIITRQTDCLCCANIFFAFLVPYREHGTQVGAYTYLSFCTYRYRRFSNPWKNPSGRVVMVPLERCLDATRGDNEEGRPLNASARAHVVGHAHVPPFGGYRAPQVGNRYNGPLTVAE